MIKYIVILAAIVFILPVISHGAHTISGAEYYIDTDPGEGKGIPLNAEDGSFNSNFEAVNMEITLPDLTIGPHYLYIRMKNEEGVWGISRKYLLMISGTKTVSESECYIDTDPGEGNGIPLNKKSEGLFELSEIDTSDLEPGIHHVFVRMKNSEGTWGQPRKYPFEVFERCDNLFFSGAEYYIDTYPEEVSGKPFKASDGGFDQEMECFEGEIDITDLTAGEHRLYIRSEDSCGRWEQALQVVFSIDKSGSVSNIESIPYTKQTACLKKEEKTPCLNQNEPKNWKAIIVAGGGAGGEQFPVNSLWDITKMLAERAKISLKNQGISDDNIYYLVAPSISEFQSYIKELPEDDTENLFIYMVDHGGNKTFRINEKEVLEASELDTWLSEIQEIIPGCIVLVYDACQSGSFIPVLAGNRRIIVSSASAIEKALFASGGILSFGYIFWSRFSEGDSFYDSYVFARKTMELIYSQISQLDADGDAASDERDDYDIAMPVQIGNETKWGNDIPNIYNVSPGQTLKNETSALIYAEDVTDADNISRVWAVIESPDFSTDSSADKPVTDIPIIDFKFVGNNRYEATYL